jgi:hypothetical protein
VKGVLGCFSDNARSFALTMFYVLCFFESTSSHPTADRVETRGDSSFSGLKREINRDTRLSRRS